MPKRLEPAKTEREWWAMLKSKDTTFIRSMKDWRAALADPKRNPLQGCDPKTIKHFTANLRFKNGGLGHADYSRVGRELSYFRFKSLWASFGLGMELFEDHEGYECSGKGNCKKMHNNICTSNC